MAPVEHLGKGSTRIMTRAKRIRARRLLAAAVCAFDLGCYASVPISTDVARAGTQINVELTDTGISDVARQVGPRIHLVTGDVVSATDGELVLAVRSVTDLRGIESPWAGEHVTVPRADVATVSERRLSSRRTALFSAGFVAALYLTARAFGLIGGGPDHSGDIPVTQ
jgi:hypothetical protein